MPVSADDGGERVLVLVKAAPNPSKTHGETVCCAGVTAAREWRRLFPVRFRHLSGERRFRRWEWVRYRWSRSRDDPRPESRRVHEESIAPDGVIPERERADLLGPMILRACSEATARGHSLALVRPKGTRFYAKKKSVKDVAEEREAFVRAMRQGSLLDRELAAYEPAPYDFRMKVEDADGHHDYGCGDWETAAAFFNLRRRYGEEAALRHLSEQYNVVRPGRGMVLAMGTVKKRPDQWLLLGVLVLEDSPQAALLI
jgi:hypothetical protein